MDSSLSYIAGFLSCVVFIIFGSYALDLEMTDSVKKIIILLIFIGFFAVPPVILLICGAKERMKNKRNEVLADILLEEEKIKMQELLHEAEKAVFRARRFKKGDEE